MSTMAITWQKSMLAACGLVLAVLACSAPTSAMVLQPGFYSNLTAVPLGGGKDQSVTIGSTTWQDRLLLRETAYKESMWMIVRDADIVYPKKNEVPYTISCIKVLDQRRDGKNGEIKVKQGGIGTKNVLLRFHSQRGHSLNYVVELYGH